MNEQEFDCSGLIWVWLGLLVLASIYLDSGKQDYVNISLASPPGDEVMLYDGMGRL